jgi:hypothetical protein
MQRSWFFKEQTGVSSRVGYASGIVLLAFVLLAGCAGLPAGTHPEVRSEFAKGQTFVLWMLSDIQPANVSERRFFEQAVADVNEGVAQVEMGVIAGDLLASRSQDEAFAWFLATRNRSKVRHWYEIAGNHDVRSGPVFRKYFPRPPYYGVRFGNILLLLLSDETPSSKTEISEEAFSWWRDMVLRHQEQIIITVTHGQLQNSGLLGSAFESRRIKGSDRFERVLQESHVAVWASGHVHLPQALPGTVSIREELGGTCFVNVSAIDTGLLLDSQSRFLVFKEGSDTLLIRSRNHSRGLFDEGLDVTLHLDKPYAPSNDEPSVIFPP